jgi:hypothetical protein
MTGLGAERVAVIVAATDAHAIAREGLARFVVEVAGRGEVILVESSRRGDEEVVLPGLRHLRRPPGRLAPELWAVGLDATDAPLVAFSTAAMVPGPGWLEALLDRLGETGAAAVGGPIAPGPGLSAFDHAVFLHRYARYIDPIEGGEIEPPGENALYRRDRLEALGRPWRRGFWEAEVYPQLRARGERVVMAGDAIVTFAGGSRPAATLLHRLAHARRYAAGRARGRGLAYRIGRTIAAPVVPAVLLARIARARRAAPDRIRWAMPTLRPSLAIVLMAWALGEVAGLWLGPDERDDEDREAGPIPARLARSARGA